MPRSVPKATAPKRDTLRLDRWLWHARIFRSRKLAAEALSAGRIRLNGQRVTKPGHGTGAGDTLTIPFQDRILLLRVTQTGIRRGPASEARSLYVDLDAQPAPPVLNDPAA